MTNLRERFWKRNALLSALIVAGLAGCTTLSSNDRGTAGYNSGASNVAHTNDGALGDPVKTGAVPDEPVRPGIAQGDTSDGINSDANAAESADADDNNAASDERSAQSGDRAATVQVSCPEPSGAQPGQCFSRVLYPAKFSEQQVQEVVRPAYEKITYTDPVYEDQQEQVLVRDQYTREVEVPALYDTYFEQVLEKPAGKVWKKGHGAVERVDPQTGEIYCLVEEPAVYRTVERKELKRPAGTRTEVVPAEYTTRTVHKLVTPPREVRTMVPAETAPITHKTLTSGDTCEYVQVLCQDNATSAKIEEVERALQQRGYQVDVNGVDDENLAAALKKFQTDSNLPETGLMTARTLEVLAVPLEPVQKPKTTSQAEQQ